MDKKCTKCNIIKDVINFYRDKYNKTGYKSQCKECLKYNHIKYKELEKEYRLKNKDKIRETIKKWRNNNKEKCAQYTKKYVLNNKEKVKKRYKEWLLKNPEYYKNYKKEHKKEHSKYIYNYNKKKLQEDPLFKLKCNIRNRLRMAMKLKNWKKDNKTLKILGCSLEELKVHLESKFQPGMTWDNYGEWEIDHIIPLSKAKTKVEIYNLNHYSNLQPLWKIDNIKKGNK